MKMIEPSQEAFTKRMELLGKIIIVCCDQLKRADAQGRRGLTDDEIKSVTGSCCAVYKDDDGNKCVEFLSEDAVKRISEGILAEGFEPVQELIKGGKINNLMYNLSVLGPEYVAHIGKDNPLARLVSAAGNN